MILIIDNESNFIKKFEKKVKNKLKYRTYTHSEQIDFSNLKVKGVILSGGPGDPFGENITTDFQVLMNLKVPIIGFCLGHEIIAVAYGGKVRKLPEKQNKMQYVVIDKKDPIFKGIGKDTYLREKHHKHVIKLPRNFEILAHSDVCPIEVMKHKKKLIYGFQSHPEVSGKEGFQIMKNFLKMCKERI